MKIKVFNPEPEEEKVLTLALQQEGDRVVLIAVDPETGMRKDYGNLLLISEEGELILGSNISCDLGLKLDDRGRLVIHDSRGLL